MLETPVVLLDNFDEDESNVVKVLVVSGFRGIIITLLAMMDIYQRM